MAALLGKQYAAVYALCLTGLVMVLIDPSQLTAVGFQLSYLATLGIILLQPVFGKSKEQKSIATVLFTDDVKTTLAAQIATAPILLANFGQINLLSIVANALVLWMIPIVSIIGGIAAILGLVFEPLAHISLYLAIPFLWFFITVITLSSKVPLMLGFATFPPSLIAGYYVLLLASISYKKKPMNHMSGK
jgi:competence protein ComEC